MEPPVSPSFTERSAWIQLAAVLLVLGGYFVVAWRMWSAGVTVLQAYAPVFTGAVILLVIVMIAGHTAAAIVSRPENRDERDRLIAWRAASYSGWIVAAGAIVAIGLMLLSLPNTWTAHLLLALFLSQVLELTLQIVFYRRGA